jgi:serine/threonine protein kinase
VVDFGLSKTLVPVTVHGQVRFCAAAASRMLPAARLRLGHGLLQHLEDTYKMTGETGSYRYMAPEVFRHEPYNLKASALFESTCLTGCYRHAAIANHFLCHPAGGRVLLCHDLLPAV